MHKNINHQCFTPIKSTIIFCFRRGMWLSLLPSLITSAENNKKNEKIKGREVSAFWSAWLLDEVV
ncbi:hypothetical protein V6Z11_D02G230400 [Gossypium hirsutum]